MAKHFELIEGEKSNWKIIFFLLIDKLIPLIKPGDIIERRELVCDAGMTFICDHLGEVKYGTDKALENRFQGTINTMVKKKFILTNGAGTYALTNKGYEILIKIREAYDPEKKKAYDHNFRLDFCIYLKVCLFYLPFMHYFITESADIPYLSQQMPTNSLKSYNIVLNIMIKYGTLNRLSY